MRLEQRSVQEPMEVGLSLALCGPQGAQSCSGACPPWGNGWEKHLQPSWAEVGAVMGGLAIGDRGPKLGILG